MNRFTIFAAALAVSTSLIATAADAQAVRDSGVRQMTVRYNDLDLTSDRDMRKLLRRLDAAGSDVCGPAADIRDVAATSEFRSCRKRAIAEAVGNSGLPGLIARHEGRGRSVQLAGRQAR